MTLQLVAVCAAAGIIVGVITLTGVGSRFPAVLLGIANQSRILALFFAMCVAIIPGRGMPTTAACVGAASVIAPRGHQPRGSAAHGAFPHFLLRRDFGHHPACRAGLLRRRGARGVRPHEDARRKLPDRARGLHRALHVLLFGRDAPLRPRRLSTGRMVSASGRNPSFRPVRLRVGGHSARLAFQAALEAEAPRPKSSLRAQGRSFMPTVKRSTMSASACAS